MSDFFFPDPSKPLDLGTTKGKYDNNIEALRILKQCEAEGRPATPEEQAALARYVGWGDSSVLDYLLYGADGRRYYRRESLTPDVEGLLTEDEYESLRASTLNAHYTDLAVVDAIWAGVTHLGITGPEMRILDPSAGIGHFRSAAPSTLRNAEWVEIELDRITARILSLLHPSSKVFAQGYEDTPLPNGYFDLIISNVPFGNYPVGRSIQPLPPFTKKSIHDFFFANSVALLRPGGIMAFITSRFTLDKQMPRFREYLAEQMDLVAAVRLPYTAFKRNAGTEVVTDIIFLQKREAPRDDSERPIWIDTKEMEVWRDGYQGSRWNVIQAHVNAWYHAHPEFVLGKQDSTGTMYRGDGYNVSPLSDDEEKDSTILAERIRTQLLNALPEGAAVRKAPAVLIRPEAPAKTSKPGTAFITSAEVSGADEARLKALHAIYRTAKSLLAAEIAGNPTDGLRRLLNEKYDEFVLRYGVIHAKANERLIKNSVEGPFLLALEAYDEASGTAEKADIFNESLVREEVVVEDPTPMDALLVCLDKKGKVDLPYIASITGETIETVIDTLGDRIFQLPEGGWEVADAYLSGDVRAKLNAAKAAAFADPAFERNVKALEAALPKWLEPAEISAPLGAGWVPPEYIEAFLQHLIGKDSKDATFSVAYDVRQATWFVKYTGPEYRISKLDNTSTWGTGRMPALTLVQLGLNAKTPVVTYLDEKDKRVVDQAETAAAQQKLGDIKAEFDRWLWEDPERAERLAEIYNHRFNAYVVREYDGSHLTLPGLNRGIELRPGQKRAVWRILQEPTTLLWHDVGYGKTLSGIVSAMESKRLGLTHKAMVVVPNHLVGQWHAAAILAYPNANILVATPYWMKRERRGQFMSMIATNDWDIVIVPFSSFKLLPVAPKTEAEFYRNQVKVLEEYLYDLASDGDDPASKRTIKNIEKTKKRFEAKIEKLGDMAKDAVGTIIWNELGVDMLIVDEFHAYKNLFFPTKMNRIAGLPNTDSQRAFDMYIKTRYLLQHGGKFVGLTGTPVTNTLAELFTMQRYFQQEVLDRLGLSHFDAWANQFAHAETALEITPDGTGFRMNNRFRSFVNVPELLRMVFQFADRQRIDKKSGIERPDLITGGPIKVLVDGGPKLREFTRSLAARAEKIRSGLVKPWEDNMLVVTSDGRKAALDISLVLPAEPDAPMPKVDALVEAVVAIYEASAPVKGTQLIFCDLATPKPKKKR